LITKFLSVRCRGSGKGAVVAKKPGRPRKGELADLTIQPPQPPAYELPPPEECEEIEGSVGLDDEDELRIRFVLWKDRYMVEFAIVQLTRINGHWTQVARIDTCHAHVHRHQLRRDSPGDVLGTVYPLEAIPAVGGWEVVDRRYEESLTLMHTEWQTYLRRWNGG
jgi:hypothetical protein